MTAQLRVTDNRDGTGMTAHVSNLTPGVTYQLQSRKPGQENWFAFLGAIDTPGDYLIPSGVVLIDLPLVYQFRLFAPIIGGFDEESNYSAMGGSDAEDSIHYRAMLGLAARFIDTHFPTIGHNVYTQLYPDEKPIVFPNILLTAVETEQVEMVDDSSQKVMFPVVVDLCDRNDKDYLRPLKKYLRWRFLMLSEYRNQPLDVNGNHRAIPGVDEVSRIHIAPRPIIDPNLPAYQYVQSGFVIWCETYLTTVGQE